MIIIPIVKGLLSYVPGIQSILKRKGTGGTDSAYYCYGVWIKHLTLLWKNGMHSIPHTIVEVGPGDSIGVGLSAMLSGTDTYCGVDVVRHADTDLNLEIFEELVELFRNRARSPITGWPDFGDCLDENLFPSHILTDELLDASLSERRVAAIRNAIENSGDHDSGVTIQYIVPWSGGDVIEKDSVDLILSHAVLEHIVDIDSTYRAFYAWLKPEGVMTHQIDFTSHLLAKEWNGYRAYPEPLWKIIVGKRPYWINRQPVSVHMDLITENGFNVIYSMKRYRRDGIQRSALSNYWKGISDDDLQCSGAFIQAQKPPSNVFHGVSSRF